MSEANLTTMRAFPALGIAIAVAMATAPVRANAAPPDGEAPAAPTVASPARASGLGSRLLVRFRADVPPAARTRVLQSAGAVAGGGADSGGVQVVHAADPAASVVRLSARPEIRWVEREVLYRRLAEVTSTPERDEVGFDAASTASARTMRGAGVAVAVIDDGVDPLNPDLAPTGKLLDGGDYTGEIGATGLTPSGDHGTSVAAIIAAAQGNGAGIVGGAPDAVIRSYRVFGRGAESASSAAIRSAILRAVADGVAVINLSVGGPFRSQAVSESIESARTADVVVVVASGNDGAERPNFPAADRGVISVGASQQVSPGIWSVASFSNGGSVDVLAPGVDVTTWSRDAGGARVVRTLDGTSFAAPQVAAIAAGLAASGVRGDRARAAIAASAEARAGGIPARSGAGRADAAMAYAVATGGTPYTAVFVPDGHTIANQVGHREVEALRWDPLRGNADDGSPTVTATVGTVGAPAVVATRDIGAGRLHTVVAPYDAPRPGSEVPTNAEVVAARPGDTAERLPLRLVEPTNGPEGLPVASGAPQSASLVHGTTSSYIRSMMLPASPRIDLRYTMPPTSRLSTLLVWAPRANGGAASSHDVPVDGVSAPGGSSVLQFPSPAAGPTALPAGRYVFGFLLDPFDETAVLGLPRNIDDGTYTLRADSPAGVFVSGPAVQLVTDAGVTSAFAVRWGARSTNVVYDLEWTQRYRDAAGRWYIGAWRAWSGFTGTTRTSGTFGVDGATVASPTKTYFIRVRARDTLGNVSPWSAFRQYVVPVDDRYSFISYTGMWRSDASGSAYLGTLRTTASTASLRLAADTAGFTVVGERCPTCGQLRLRVDGGPWRTVDTRGATTSPRTQLHYTGSFGAIGRHTLEVQALATPGRPRVAIDAIAVIR